MRGLNIFIICLPFRLRRVIRHSKSMHGPEPATVHLKIFFGDLVKFIMIFFSYFSFFYIIWFLFWNLFFNWIFFKNLFELFYIILSPLFFLIPYAETFIVIRCILFTRWYESFIEEHSILAHSVINNKFYMPHDFILDIFFFMLYRFPDTKINFYVKWVVVLILSPLLSPILFIFLFFIFIVVVPSSLFIFLRLWRNIFWSYEKKLIAKFVTIDDILNFYKSPTIVFILFFGHNLTCVSIYYKLFFFGRRNIYYHNLPLLEKIKIFNNTYFKAINRDSNFFFLLIVFFFFSIFEVIFFNRWRLSEWYKFPKIFFSKFFKNLKKNYLYLANSMTGAYALKKIKIVDGKLVL